MIVSLGIDVYIEGGAFVLIRTRSSFLADFNVYGSVYGTT